MGQGNGEGDRRKGKIALTEEIADRWGNEKERHEKGKDFAVRNTSDP